VRKGRPGAEGCSQEARSAHPQGHRLSLLLRCRGLPGGPVAQARGLAAPQTTTPAPAPPTTERGVVPGSHVVRHLPLQALHDPGHALALVAPWPRHPWRPHPHVATRPSEDSAAACHAPRRRPRAQDRWCGSEQSPSECAHRSACRGPACPPARTHRPHRPAQHRRSTRTPGTWHLLTPCTANTLPGMHAGPSRPCQNICSKSQQDERRKGTARNVTQLAPPAPWPP